MKHLLRAMLLIFVCLGAATAHAHPKPGAHADVRVNIERDRVRFSITMNALFADQLVKVPRQDPLRISDAEAAAYQAALNEYFGGARAGAITALYGGANSVHIDGVTVGPVLKSVEAIHPEPESRPGFVQNPALLLPRIHVEVEYPCKTSPQTVALVWGAYPRDFAAPDRDLAPLSAVESVVVAFGKLQIITFKNDEPEWIWHAPAAEAASAPLPPPPSRSDPIGTWWLALPVGCWLGAVAASWRRGRWRTPVALGSGLLAAAACAAIVTSGAWRTGGSRRLPDAELLGVFAPLHANIYRAFDYTNESEIYDALAQSIDGPLLDQVYGDTYRSLVMQEEGGALCRVKAVEVLSSEVLGDRPAQEPQAVRCRWRVEGVVYHWGHSHERTSEFTAEYGVALREAGWRLVSVNPLSQKHLMPADQAASQAAAIQSPPTPGSVWTPDR